MAARIGVARLKSDYTKIIMACDYNPNMHRGNVLCPVDRCRCELQGVQAGTRNVNGEQIAVDAFFRLPSNAEKAGRGHTPVCRYNIDHVVTRLVGSSRKIDRFDKNAEPLLARLRGKGAEFRIHILMEVLRALRNGPSGSTAISPEGEASPVGTRYVRSKNLLLPYLRIAKAVLSLVARVQDRPELAEQIRLKYGSRTIPWDNYFFDFDDYGSFYDQVVPKEAPSKQGSRPVALAVEIIPGAPRLTRSGSWQTSCRAIPCNTAAHGRIVVRPVLYFREQASAVRVASQVHLLVCGIPKPSDLKQPNKSWLKPEAGMRFEIISGAQVCRYSPMLKSLSP